VEGLRKGADIKKKSVLKKNEGLIKFLKFSGGRRNCGGGARNRREMRNCVGWGAFSSKRIAHVRLVGVSGGAVRKKIKVKERIQIPHIFARYQMNMF